MRNIVAVLVFRTVICLLLAMLCGCSTSRPRLKAGAATDWEDPSFAVQPAPTRTSDPAAVGEVPRKRSQSRVPAETWVSVEEWTRQHDFGEVTPLSPDAPSGYEISSTNGRLMIWPQLKSVLWNGLDVRLGFAPRSIEGHLFVHRLDLEKNLYPLLAQDQPNESLRHRRIVIDPGHGGSNTGTRSRIDGRFEKEFTLDWALRLRDLLEEEGWDVLLTRTNDTELSLADRVAFAETNQADLFISLHFNASPSRSDQAGVETYCVTPAGMPSNLVRDGEDNLSAHFPNNAFDEANLLLAVRLHQALVKEAAEQDRGVRRARFMGVLRWQNRPAVLVEGGYLSNPDEARQIAQDEHRQKLAVAIARALGNPKPELAAAVPPAETHKTSLE